MLPLLAMRNLEHGSGLGRWRWVVERTFAWVNQFRRLRLRYEKRADMHKAFLSLASALICWNFLQDLRRVRHAGDQDGEQYRERRWRKDCLVQRYLGQYLGCEPKGFILRFAFLPQSRGWFRGRALNQRVARFQSTLIDFLGALRHPRH